VRAARLKVIKADILDHLDEPSLAVGAVAARGGVTTRYVQLLFEEQGTTFTEFVLEQRLARIHRYLSEPRFAGLTITDVAFMCGFGDLSYFYRAFRRRYGATPSDVRQSIQQELP
jgi:AraC-like DNA-binding protein